MATPIILDLGSVDLGTGGETSPVEVCYQYGWSIAPTVTGTAGNADYTLLVSQDNITYFEYTPDAVGVSVEDAIQDSQFNWSWVKISVDSGGGSSGSVSFSMELKNG